MTRRRANGRKLKRGAQEGYEEEMRVKPAKRGYVPTPSEPVPCYLRSRLILAVPAARPVPTIGPAQARIAKALAEANAAKTDAEHALEVAVGELSMLEEQERDLKKEVERVEGKREWSKSSLAGSRLLASSSRRKWVRSFKAMLGRC